MKSPPRISEAEWQVIKPIWQEPGLTAAEIIDRLACSVDWSPATIKTLLNRLLQKGALRFDKEGKAYRYTAIYSEEALRAAEGRSFLARVFDGAFSPMMAHFIGTEELDDAELDELEELLRQERLKRRHNPKP